MRRSDLLLTAGGSACLLLGFVAAGPVLSVGAVAGALLLAAIYAWPMAGLALMILSGTALQVLGSEHITHLPVSLSKLAGVATLLAWGWRSLLRGTRLTYSPQLPALCLFGLALAIATLAAPDPGEAREGLFRYAQLGLLWFMIASIAGESPRKLDATCIALSVCVTLSSLIGLAEFLLPSLALESDDPGLAQGMIGAIIDRDSLAGETIKRITGGLSDSNWFAYTLVGVLPINLYLLSRSRAAWQGWSVLAMAGLQCMGVALSYTRSAVIALGVAVVVLVWAGRLRVLPLLLAAAVGGAGLLVWNPPGISRMFSSEYAQTGSTPLRLWMLRGGMALVQDRPVLGYGYNQFGPNFMTWLERQKPGEAVDEWQESVRSRVDAGEERLEHIMPHNTVVQAWVEFGLLGLAGFGAFLACIGRDAMLARRRCGGAGVLGDCLLAGLAGFAVCALFGHLTLLKIPWILGGLAAALRRVALTGEGPDP